MTRRFLSLTPIAVFALMLAISFIPQRTLAAATFVVDSDLDSHDDIPGNGVCWDSGGRCTLRAAIEEANAWPGEDTIEIPTGPFNLNLGVLTIEDDVIITGAGSGNTTIKASPAGSQGGGHCVRWQQPRAQRCDAAGIRGGAQDQWNRVCLRYRDYQ
ncbi:MAG: hypothetical protein P1S60_02230 [Anaerolineae bacterium]|nr:hypothetical protein [Anaerolineae bacterium]